MRNKHSGNNLIVKEIYSSTYNAQLLTLVAAFAGSLIDGIVTGQCLGFTFMASYGIVFPIISIFSGIASIFETGVSVLCAKSIGEGNREKTNMIFNQSFLFALLLSAAVTIVVCVFSGPISVLMGAPEDLMPEASAYLFGIGFSVPAMALGFMLLPVMQLDGDKKRQAFAVISILAVNIAGDLLNAFVLHMGLLGMALATTLSYYVGLVILLFHFRRNNDIFRIHIVKPDFRMFGQIAFCGFQRALEYFLKGLMLITLNHIILSTAGEDAVDAYSAVYTLSIVCSSLGMASGQSMTLIASVFLGEKDADSIYAMMRYAVFRNIRDNIILIMIVLIAAPLLITLFITDNPAACAIGITGLRYYALSILFYALNSMIRGYCRAMHYTVTAYIIIIFGNYLSVSAFAFILSRFNGLDGVWISFLLGELLTLLIYLVPSVFMEMRKKKKLTVNLIDALARIGESLTANIIAEKVWECREQAGVIDTSEETRIFCRENDSGDRTAYIMALSVEELGMNILKFGFNDGKQHSIEVKVIKLDSGWILRIRDDCAIFDPVHYMENFNFNEPGKRIGIRMISGLAHKMEYTKALKFNQLLVEMPTRR